MAIRIWVLSALCIFVAGHAAAADQKIVTYFEGVCGACHGDVGQGTANLAPPLKGNKYVIESSEAEIGNTITKGRDGAAKRYKNLPSPMPAQTMSAERLAALVSYLTNELQK
jgi:mono/diheme cytochrome c family protein